MTELQEKLLDLLKQIDALCRENDVEYYLTGGTLIGALRHKGFIPWDDDADVLMTRENWIKFAERTRGKLPEGVVLNSPYEDISLATTVGHYVDTKTAAIYRYDLTNPEKTGIVIDIVIMDPVPENKTQEYVQALTTHTELVVLPYLYSLRMGEHTHFGKYWNLSKRIGLRETLERISKDAFSHTEEGSRFYAQRYAGAPHFWPKEYYGKPKYVPFENTMLPIPQRAGDCLCIGYDDDWMYVPRGGATKSTHTFCVRSLSVPGELITDDFEQHINRKELLRTFVKRKKLMELQTKNKFRQANDSFNFFAAKIQLVYKRKMKDINLSELLEKRNYLALEDFFDEYIRTQCTSHFLGSSSLEGWLNWYRKCNPLLIDIGDDALYAVLVLLMHKQKLAWTGKLLKARKAIERPLTEQLQEMDALYGAIKAANSAYECEEDERCREIVNEWLPGHPDNPFLWKLDLKGKVRQDLAGQPLLDATSVGLELFPDDPEILCLQADSYFDLGDHDKALDIYRTLAETTNHGLVLLHIRERLEQLIADKPGDRALYEIWLAVRKQSGEEDVPTIETFFPENEEIAECETSLSDEMHHEEAEHSLTDIQKKRLQLLNEIDAICRENKIKYFLFGKTLLQAARGGKYIDEHGDLVVAMTPANCERFTKAVKAIGSSDRYLDSMAENPQFHRFCLRYCDSDSLDFEVGRSGAGDQFGIFVTIEVLRCPAKNKVANQIDQMLEGGWESMHAMKWTSKKRFISWFVVSAMCMILGRRNVGKLLYRHFMKNSKKATANYYLKPFWGKRIYYPSYLFKYSCDLQFEGRSFSTMKLFDQYLSQAHGKKWKTNTFPETKPASFTRIVDAGVSSRDYLAFLQENRIDRDGIWKHRIKTDRKYAKVLSPKLNVSHYWDIMCMCGERYRLWEKYTPMKTYIIELYRSNRIKDLAAALEDYLNTALAFSKKNLGLCFDKQIFEILEYTLLAQGKVKLASKLRKLIPKQDWVPLRVTDEMMGVEGMRRATQNDVPAILTYLERNVSDCLYMYIDIAKYGLENPNMKVWFDADDRGVKLVIMKYHTSINVYSDRESWDAEAVAGIIRQEKVMSVTGPKSMIEKLHSICREQYRATYGWVFSFTTHRAFEDEDIIEPASEGDALEIAKLIAMDEGIGSYYEIENLANQLTERMQTGMGRSYIIREGGRIIAHIASYAEFDNLATTSGLIVHPDYRSGVYGAMLESYLLKRLIQDGFNVYTFVTNRLRYKLLQAIGNKCVGEYGKMMLNSEWME